MEPEVLPAGPAEPLLQPVVPLRFWTVRSKPPMNDPQVTPAALSKSPTFCPFMLTTAPLEQTSPNGSGPLITVNEPAPPSTTAKPAAAATSSIAPSTCP